MPFGDNDSALDKYVDTISDLDSDSSSTSVESTTNDTGGDNGQSTSAAPTTSAAGNFADNASATQDQQNNNALAPKPNQPQGQNKGQQPGKGQQAATKEQLRPLGDGNFTNAKGDLLDAQGNIIAVGGFMRRQHDVLQRTRQAHEALTHENTQLKQQLQSYQGFANAAQSAGLTNDDFHQMVVLASRFKRGDAVGVAKEMVAMALAQGANVTDILGKDVGDTLEMRAMSAMIDQRLGPMNAEFRARQQRQQNEAAGRQQYQKFVAEHPFAELHGKHIAGIMESRGWPAEKAYYELRDHMNRNGFDFSQPLDAQLQARQQQQRNPQQQNNVAPNNVRPMPNGASTRSAGAVAQAQQFANADDSWDSILKDVMANN